MGELIESIHLHLFCEQRGRSVEVCGGVDDVASMQCVRTKLISDVDFDVDFLD